MRYWLLALSFLLLNARAQTPFPGTALPTFTFKETYIAVVRQEPGSPPEDESFVPGAQRSLRITGTAPLTGFDLSTINEETAFSIIVGGFSSTELEGLTGFLTDDESWDPDQTGPSPDRSVDFPIVGYDYEGNPVDIGSIALSWNASQVNFTVSINTINSPLTEWGFSQGVLAESYIGDNIPEIGADLPAAFSFGPFSFDLKNVFVVGSVVTPPDNPQGDLSNITLDGAIDSIAPTLTVQQPPPGKTTITEADGVTPDFRYTLTGTAADTRRVGAITYPGTIDTVEIRLGTPAVEGEFEDAEVVVDENGNWSWANAQLEVGRNVITFRVTDAEGNTFTTPPRTVTISTTGRLDILADARTGYPPGTTGVAGTVSVTGPAIRGTISAMINADPATIGRPAVEAGQNCTVVAKSKPGHVFDGWEGKLNGTVVFTSASEKLVFETKPFLQVTAKFRPNPFTAPMLGVYQGLITGDSAAERGIFRVTIGKTGAFSGKIKIGAQTLTIKSKILARGTWFGMVKKGTKIYNVQFALNIGENDERSLLGTITGEGIDADLTADVTDWRKPKGANPGKLVTAQKGTYNVILPAAEANTDPDFPRGFGYGRVTISDLGVVKFAGKLGDGTSVSATTTLVQRKEGTVFFPLFIPLDKKLGNIAGQVVYEHLAETDLTGTLDWAEPTTTGVVPQDFSGQALLTGARYEAPAAGQRIMLEAAAGLAELTMEAPFFTKPAASSKVQPSAFNRIYQVTLDPLQNILASTDSTGELTAFKFKLKFAPKTGLFTGSYRDPALSKTVDFNGVVIRQANGGAGFAAGVFIRGNQAGAITIAPRGQ